MKVTGPEEDEENLKETKALLAKVMTELYPKEGRS